MGVNATDVPTARVNTLRHCIREALRKGLGRVKKAFAKKQKRPCSALIFVPSVRCGTAWVTSAGHDRDTGDAVAIKPWRFR